MRQTSLSRYLFRVLHQRNLAGAVHACESPVLGSFWILCCDCFMLKAPLASDVAIPWVNHV